MRIHIGVSRKLCDNNFGSRGASLSMEVEIEDSIANDASRLQDEVRRLYSLVRSQVNEELTTRKELFASRARVVANSNPSPSVSSQVQENATSAVGEPAKVTQSQLRAIYAIARKQNLEPFRLSRERFGVVRPELLTRREASTLITDLSPSPSPSPSPSRV